MRFHKFIWVLLIFVFGCNKATRDKSETSALLASVNDNHLYLSDLNGMITATTKQDSSVQINSLIESWVRKATVLDEATKNISPTIDIETLVEDYRASLLVHNYRQQFVKNNLDTIVTGAQEEEFYEKTKENYLTSSAICNAWIVKLPKNTSKLETFFKNWKKADTSKVVKYIDEHSVFEFNSAGTYVPLSKVKSHLPVELFDDSDFKKYKVLQDHKDDFEYFVYISNYIDKNQVPPLSYIGEKIRQVIIHQREQKILKSQENAIYDKYIKNKDFEVFYQ